MSEFELDPRLAGDSVALADIGAIHVRAMVNAPWPWLVLIPCHPEAVELFDPVSYTHLTLPTNREV